MKNQRFHPKKGVGHGVQHVLHQNSDPTMGETIEALHVSGLLGWDPFTDPALLAKPDPKYEGHVYLIQAGDYWKVGYSRNPEKRIASIEASVPMPVRTELVIWLHKATFAERKVHRKFAQYRVKGEWYRFPPEVVEKVKSSILSWRQVR